MTIPKLEYPLVEKLVKKNRSRVSICGSFDHPDMHSLNDYKFVFFGLPTEVLGI
jgi:hypothetical protein